VLPLDKRRALEQIVTEARSKWRITFERPDLDHPDRALRYVYDGQDLNPVTSLGTASHRLSQDHKPHKASEFRIVLEPVHREGAP